MKPKQLSASEYSNYLKNIGYGNTVELEGQEKENVWKILQLLEPIECYNNQRTFTEIYEYQNIKYKVHHGIGKEVIIELIK